MLGVVGGKIPHITVYPKDRRQTKSTSKGNQDKWKNEDNMWIKRDMLGYEGLAEVVSLDILDNTNAYELGYRYVEYGICTINEHPDNPTYQGCYSEDFLGKDGELITLDRLFKALKDYRKGFLEGNQINPRQSIMWVVDTVTKITGIEEFGKWLTFLLEFDQIILNEDRHFNNIGVVRRGKTYELMPIFDNGLSLFSDTTFDFRMGQKMKENYSKIKSKPFSKNFEEQVGICQELYGKQLRLDMSTEDIGEDYLNNFSIYDKDVLDRVTTVIQNQVRKYTTKSMNNEDTTRDVTKKDMNLDWL